MKNKPGTAWKLGMFVTIGFLIFLVAVYYIGKQQHLFGTTFRIKTVFTSVSGLKVGNNVRFSGIDVGTVDNIQILSDTSVLVEMVVDMEVQKFIKNDARTAIGSEGLMGDKVVVINSGTPGHPPVRDNIELVSDPPAETDQIMANILVTTENAEIITDQLAEITWKINNGEGAISKLLMDSAIGEDLSRTLTNLKESSKSLNQNMEAAKHSFLLKGFFKKKQKEKEQKEKELMEKEEKKKEEQQDKK